MFWHSGQYFDIAAIDPLQMEKGKIIFVNLLANTPTNYFVQIENNKFIIVNCSKLKTQSSGFGMTSSFDSALKYCGICTFF